MNPEWFSIAIASRPAAGERAAADAWQLAWHETTCRLALIGAPGGGLTGANDAASAIGDLAREPKLDPARAIEHLRLAGNGNGALAIFVARIDAVARSLTVAGTGAIAASLYQNGACHDLVDERGVAGGVLGQVRQLDLPIGDDWLLLVRTGGGPASTELQPMLATKRGMCAVTAALLREMGSPDPGASLLLAGPR